MLYARKENANQIQDKTQSVKIEQDKSYIMTNIIPTLERNYISLKIGNESHIFKTTAFTYDRAVENDFYRLPIMSITNALTAPEDQRISVQGLVTHISKVIGDIFPRIEVIITSMNNNVHTQLKITFWNEKRDLTNAIQLGQLITVYAVRTGSYGNQKRVNSTDQSHIEINEVQLNRRLLTIIGYDNTRDDTKVEVITDIGQVYTMTEEQFHSIISDQKLPISIDAQICNNHITNYTVRDINETEEEPENDD